MPLNRRTFLKSAALTTAAATISPTLVTYASTSSPAHFDFVFFTDTHIQPELDAAHGCDMAFRKIATINADFAIMGGDHVFDALSVDRTRANTVFDLYKTTEQSIKMPLHHTIGNHDVFGILPASGVAPTDPGYAKKMYEDRMGKTYYSFDHKGWHFIILDSIQPTEDHAWQALIPAKQLSWLKDDLAQTGTQKPIIVTVHAPLVSAFATYAPKSQPGHTPPAKYNTMTVDNSAEVLAAFEGHNIVAVLQGHLHINEIVTLRGVQYITGGAVCGNWWRGPLLGYPEGFTVVSARNGSITTRYESYGFKAIASPENS